MFRQRLMLLVVALAAAALVFTPAASAHKTTFTDDGKIKIVWGFVNEPATTWTKTGLDLRLSDNLTGAPIVGAQDTLTVHLLWGDQELHFERFRGAHGSPGAYTDIVTLTQAGLYSINLKGTINGTAVDMTIPGAHEIAGIEDSFFPSIAASPYAPGDAIGAEAMRGEIASLKERLSAIEAKIKTQAETPAVVTDQASGATRDTPGPGVIGLAVAVVGAVLLLRRRG